MTALLSETSPIARKAHRCNLCMETIEAGTSYLNQRCADGATAWTFKAHHDCNSAYWSWGVDGDDVFDLTDLTDGHLPPCWHAWNHDRLHYHYTERFIGPPAPCTCDRVPYT